jgi:hypothetical protein
VTFHAAVKRLSETSRWRASVGTWFGAPTPNPASFSTSLSYTHETPSSASAHSRSECHGRLGFIARFPATIQPIVVMFSLLFAGLRLCTPHLAVATRSIDQIPRRVAAMTVNSQRWFDFCYRFVARVESCSTHPHGAGNRILTCPHRKPLSRHCIALRLLIDFCFPFTSKKFSCFHAGASLTG